MDPTSLVSNIWRQHQYTAGRGDMSVEGSNVTEHSAGSRRRRRSDVAVPAGASEDESSKLVSTSSGNDLTDSEARRLKVVKTNDENMKNLKSEAETDSGAENNDKNQIIINNNNNNNNNKNKKPEVPKQDYIHVRARRGQATDSHSLAERARREKISERMKILQDLVPGCNKVIGKASVLDEIINYIQALQRQVEFLSMKLEAVNSHMSSGIEAFPSKDFGTQSYNPTPNLGFDAQTSQREYNQTSASEWLHMQVGGAFERVT